MTGFYDDVEAVTAADEADMEAADLDEGAEMAALGAKGPYGEAGFSTLARRHVVRSKIRARFRLQTPPFRDEPCLMSHAMHV